MGKRIVVTIIIFADRISTLIGSQCNSSRSSFRIAMSANGCRGRNPFTASKAIGEFKSSRWLRGHGYFSPASKNQWLGLQRSILIRKSCIIAFSLQNNYRTSTHARSPPIPIFHIRPFRRSCFRQWHLACDGRLLYAGKAIYGDEKIGVCESNDDGLTWEWIATIPTRSGDDPARYHELHLVDAADGSLICHIRNENKRDDGHTLQCESNDGGRTWTTPHTIGIWGFPSHLLRMRNVLWNVSMELWSRSGTNF